MRRVLLGQGGCERHRTWLFLESRRYDEEEKETKDGMGTHKGDGANLAAPGSLGLEDGRSSAALGSGHEMAHTIGQLSRSRV
jgi:hypothetical protein